MGWLLVAIVAAVFLLLVVVFGMSAEHAVTVVVYLIIGSVILLVVLGIRSSIRRNRARREAERRDQEGLTGIVLTYLDEKGRVKCAICEKLAYTSRERADAVVESAHGRGTYLRAYYEERCGNWHMSSRPDHFG